MNMIEIWKDIKDFENEYMISNYGRIKSLKYKKERILKPCKDPKGYLRIDLRNNNISKTMKIHRLVALHFIPNNKNKSQVNHIDCNKENNHVENLEWATQLENMDHAKKMLVFNKGENHPKVKLTLKNVKEIRKLLQRKHMCKELAEKYNVHVSTISAIKQNRSWKYD